MVVRKFFAANTREALRLVREALGADALILSNRPMSGGIEIMAVAENEVTAVAMPESSTAAADPAQAGSASQRPAASALSDAGLGQELLDEVRLLRDMVQGQLASFAWKDLSAGSPVQAELVRELVSHGFGPAFARAFAARLPAGEHFAKALRWAKATMIAGLRCVAAGEDIVTRGGVYALVGPTGVGKTTTVAKIAASCTLQHGPSQVALVTTDTYRIGAVDQLRIYGRILGVPVFAAKDEDDLKVTLAELHGRKLVLIDTVGMSQRDRRVAEQVAMLSGHGEPVRRLLLLSAVSQGDTLEDVMRHYEGEGLTGCILTKVDEALSLGGALDVLLRSGLPLHYVANGQRVPEDLHLANGLYLVERAFRSDTRSSGFAPSAEEIPLMMAARPAATVGARPGA